MNKYVIYFRVSTKRQGKSGLGLQAQQRDINLYFDNYTDQPYKVIGKFTDIASGTDNNRPQYKAAVALAKKNKATILVAKLDRISRKVSTIASLVETTNLKVASMPNADKFQLHIYAALAEQERDFISLRTKAALAEAKKRGVKLGGDRGGLAKANIKKQSHADQRALDLKPTLEMIQGNGITSLKGIAKKLNELGHRNSAGGEYQATQVKRLLTRIKPLTKGI